MRKWLRNLVLAGLNPPLWCVNRIMLKTNSSVNPQKVIKFMTNNSPEQKDLKQKPLKETPLNKAHQKMGARLVDFGGWNMPVHYGSQIDEHHQVRKDAGMFDVCHMTIVDLRGCEVVAYLARLLANDVAKIADKPGKALYSCMLNHSGGVIDDLIIYSMDPAWVRVIVMYAG